MGRYALGNPKNNWQDVYASINPGAFIAVYWQDRDVEDLVERTTKRIAAYEVLEKAIRFNDSTGVEWSLRDVLTNEVRKPIMLNMCWDDHTAYAVEISKEQAEALRFSAVELPEPKRNPVPLYLNYAYEFDTQGGKYPKSAEPKPFKEPVAGSRWRYRKYDHDFAVTVEGVEQWGVGMPRSVAFKRDDDEELERLTVEFFMHNFMKLS